MKSILIRYGELYLKGRNRSFFENCLKNNICNALSDYEFNFIKARGRFFVEDYDECLEKDILDKLTKIFGIHSVSPAFMVDTDYDEIYKKALLISPDKGTFKVNVKRADKRLSLNSMQIAANCGEYILKNKPNLKVDIYNPEHEDIIDIRENGKTYLMSEKLYGQGGMPVGSSGKGMLLLSGGIDSPVSAYMMAKRGLSINAVHFHSFPYTSERAKEKVIELAQIASKYTGRINLSIVSLTDIQREIHSKCPTEYMITLVRRFMLRIANILAKRNNCGVLITGESLGQVASQTIESMDTISSVSSLQILRPLIGMDKSEIINIAQRIGTYSKSIEPYEDCCTVFLPKNPVIRPTKEYADRYESKLDVDNLINEALSTLEVIDIK